MSDINLYGERDPGEPLLKEKGVYRIGYTPELSGVTPAARKPQCSLGAQGGFSAVGEIPPIFFGGEPLSPP